VCLRLLFLPHRKIAVKKEEYLVDARIVGIWRFQVCSERRCLKRILINDLAKKET
jgi:hypothetical protein